MPVTWAYGMVLFIVLLFNFKKIILILKFYKRIIINISNVKKPHVCEAFNFIKI